MKLNLKKIKVMPSISEINPRTIILLFLAVILLISLALYISSNIRKTSRIFFFPDNQSSKPIGESRKIPRIPFEKEENIDIFVKELLLGPMNMNLAPILPAGTKLEKILYRSKIVYLDLNFMALFPDKKAVHGFSNDTILLIEKNIKFNFPFVKGVVITILGQEPKVDV